MDHIDFSSNNNNNNNRLELKQFIRNFVKEIRIVIVEKPIFNSFYEHGETSEWYTLHSNNLLE